MHESIADAAISILREMGPLDDDELADALAVAGFTADEDPLEIVEELDHPLLGFLDDGRNLAMDALLEGRIFTHRLTQVEIDSGILEANPDLVLVAALVPFVADSDATVGEMCRIYGGSDGGIFAERGVGEPNRAATGLVLPTQAALTGHTPGELVGFQILDGRPLLTSVDGTADGAEIGAAISDYLSGLSAEIEGVLNQLIHENPGFFSKPVEPIGNVLAAAGVDRNVDFIAPAGFDYAAERLQRRVAKIASSHQISEQQAVAVVALEDIFFGILDGRDPEVHASAGELAGLADEFIAQIALGSVLQFERPELALETARALHRFGPRRIAAVALWMQGAVSLRLGKIDAAEQLFERSETADPRWGPALFELSRFASDRGDATRAMSLLQRAGRTDDPIFAALQNGTASTGPTTGRNERCWCGSGRKYKVCHLGKNEVPLVDRVWWLYLKAGQFGSEQEFSEIRLNLALIRAAHNESEKSLLDAINDPFLADVTLTECGVFETFIQRRGHLLPADELLLAQQWNLRERSVYEVTAVLRGSGFSARDLRTGDQFEVTERLGSTQMKAGEMYCLRLLPVGDEWQIFGGIEPVSLSQRVPLMKLCDNGDAEAIVELLSARFAPTRMATAEGDPLVFCTADFDKTRAAIRKELDAKFERSGDDQWSWLDGERVLGALFLDTRTRRLRLESTSERRFEELLDVVAVLENTGRLARDERRPAAEALAAQRDQPEPLPTQPPPPELLELIAAKVAEYEANWIDEEIPALGGFTPRAAVADPTMRDDVIRLLDSFPPGDDSTQMSAVRLRTALGL